MQASLLSFLDPLLGPSGETEACLFVLSQDGHEHLLGCSLCAAFFSGLFFFARIIVRFLSLMTQSLHESFIIGEVMHYVVSGISFSW